MKDELESVRNIGKASSKWLRAVGIESVSELRRAGAAEAYARIEFRFGRAVNLNLLYALATGLQGRAYNSLTAKEKGKLHAAAGVGAPPRVKRRS